MARSKYSDEQFLPENEKEELLAEKDARRFYQEHAVDLPSERAFTPGRGFSPLTAQSTGDWSYQPHRSNVATPTYKPPRHPRACPRCLLTSCLSLITLTVTACA